jgi:hypothetical protein
MKQFQHLGVNFSVVRFFVWRQSYEEFFMRFVMMELVFVCVSPK